MSSSKGKVKLRWVVGTHSAAEAISERSSWVKEVYLQEDRQRETQDIEELCQRFNIKVQRRGRKFLNSLADGHQGVAVGLSDRPRWEDSFAQKSQSLVVFLDGITDPHNLGAILRTAWLLEADAVFIPKDRRVDLTPVGWKVASGGAEHIPVESVHFASQLQWFKDQGYWSYGLSERGEAKLPQVKFAEKSVVIVGAEGKGLRSSTEKVCDQLVQIPQISGGSSYNASVAFAMTAYECTRNRHI